jgi:hypothetical protein
MGTDAQLVRIKTAVQTKLKTFMRASSEASDFISALSGEWKASQRPTACASGGESGSKSFGGDNSARKRIVRPEADSYLAAREVLGHDRYKVFCPSWTLRGILRDGGDSGRCQAGVLAAVTTVLDLPRAAVAVIDTGAFVYLVVRAREFVAAAAARHCRLWMRSWDVTQFRK